LPIERWLGFFFLGKGDEMRKVIIFLCIILLLAAAPLTAGAATMTFDQATMSTFIFQGQSSTLVGSFDQPSLSGSPNPVYDDNIAMTGIYGWIGNWEKAVSGESVELFIGLFTGADWTGITDLSQTFYNDNDDTWSGGVWVETANDGLLSTSVDINPLPPGPNTATVALDLTGRDVANVLGYGIVIDATFGGGMQPSPGDQFHMSSSQVPLPAAAWLLVSGLIGLLGLRRRFKS
jgi:hypothetical protein